MFSNYLTKKEAEYVISNENGVEITKFYEENND